MPNPFEKELGIPLPKCCHLGECCKGASPSTPFDKLLKRASEGDDFARGFFSIMQPYGAVMPDQDYRAFVGEANHQAARQVVPGLVDRMIQAAQKLDDFQNPLDLVFYHCRYLLPDNRCGVHEDRPQFCRDYPDTPFVVMAPGCAFEGWGKACKEKYNAMKDEVANLKEMQTELARLKSELAASEVNLSQKRTTFLVSPLGSYRFFRQSF